MNGLQHDAKYLKLLLDALHVCAAYKPMFGRGRRGGMSLEEFQQLYGADPFYAWVGLNSPVMYAAHKAAGGMTSVYRQLGIGCQWIFHQVLQDSLGLTAEQASWSYQVPKAGTDKERTLSLDGRIVVDDLSHSATRSRVAAWVREVKRQVRLSPVMQRNIHGVVFEVRQGYKSKDSKRQNADIANAANAYAHQYVPVLLLLSSQLDTDLALRYAQSNWLILTGTLGGMTTDSTYVFCRDVLGYDLADFFTRNSHTIKAELEKVLAVLLKAS